MTMKKLEYIKQYSHFIFLIFTLTAFTGIIKSQEMPDSTFWYEDATLSKLIDSLGEENMISHVDTRLEDIVQFLKSSHPVIEDDSLSSWITAIRWAVILEEENLLEKVNSLISSAESGDRGNWQFYFVYMGLTGTYHAFSQSHSEEEEVELLLDNLDALNPIQQVFYEDRVMELNARALPAIIFYAKEMIIPNMNGLDDEKLSMEDFEFYDKYYQFVDLIINILDQGEGEKLFEELLKTEDHNMQRFARDVLGISTD